MVINRIKMFFPFAITIILWYLSHPLLNPFGVLSLIPIYYYMYFRYTPYWFGFGIYMSFMLDFNASTLFLFSAAFIIMNIINETYGIIENEDGLKIRGFNVFLVSAIIMFFMFSVVQFGGILDNLINAAWLYLWVTISYFPVSWVLGHLSNDR